MNPLHFSQLSLSRKATYTWSHGHFIVSRASKYHIYYLYSIGRYYVEIGYTRKLSRIEFIDCFKDTGRLRPYLDSFQLSDMKA
ncbi:MAG: hypothetical protein ACLFUB_04375 [Cyclobacteriaceae bacterium]